MQKNTAHNNRMLYKVISLFLLCAAAIVFAGYLNYFNYAKRFRHGVEDKLEAIGIAKISQLKQWREERLADALCLSTNPLFIDTAQRFFENPETPGLQQTLKNWLAQFHTAYAYEHVFLLDAQGAQRVGTPDGSVLTCKFVDLMIPELRRSGRPCFLDLHAHDSLKHIHLSIAAPVRDQGRLVGLVVFDIDARTYLYPLIRNWPTVSRTAETLLVRRDGSDVLFLNDLKFKPDAALKLRFPLTDKDLPAVQAVLGRQGIFEGKDYRGEGVIAHIHSVPGSPWFMVTRMDTEEVYEPLRKRRLVTVVLAALLALCAGLGMLLLWRQQRVVFYRRQLEAEQEQAWLKEMIARSLNEVFVFDPHTLRFKFANIRALQNIGYSMPELAGMTPVGIHANHTEESFRLALQPLVTGKQAMLVSETLLQRKDGSSYSVEEHLQLVSTAEGPLFLSVGSDISERLKAEEALRASEAHLRDVLDATPFPVAVVDVADSAITFWSRSALDIFGHDVATVAQWYECAYPDPDYRREVIARWKQSLETTRQTSGSVNTGEYRIACKDGSVRSCELYATFLPDCLIVTFNDITARKEAEDALAASQKDFRQLAEAMPQIVWITRADGWNIYFNRQWVDYTGLTLEESYGNGWTKPFHPDDRQRAWDAWQNAVSNNGEYSLECRLRKKDGSYHWWLIRGVPVCDEWGAVLKWFGTCTDIDDQKQSEKLLKDANNELQQLFQSMLNAFVLFDAVFDAAGSFVSYRFVYINEAYERITGVTNAEVAGKTVHEVWPDTEPEWIRRYGEVAVTGIARSFDLYHGPTKKLYHCNVYRPGKSPNRFCVIFEDISERKRAEEDKALRARISQDFLTAPDDDMYNNVLNIVLEEMQSPLGVFGFLDENGALEVPTMTHQVWDKCLVKEKNIRFPRESWGDSSWPRAIREKQYNFSNTPSTNIPDGHLPVTRHLTMPIIMSNTVVGLFQVANKETDYTGEDIEKLQGMADYIAPILSARVSRERYAKNLQERNAELTRFAYAVSHDLRSPLVTIKTFIGYLEKDLQKQDADRISKDFSFMRSAADKMGRMLDELLDLTRVGRKDNPPVAAQLQTIVQEALIMTAGRITERGVKVAVTQAPLLLRGDRPRLVELFQNLIDNAVKFMGGQAEPLIEIGFESQQGETVLFVRDNGQGIDPRYLAKVFNLFEKIDPSFDGTGIGLTLVKRIVEVHGGSIWVESEGIGKGACFWFTLPGKPVQG